MVLALFVGSVSDADAAIIYQLRLPRVLAAFAIGGLLAMSGALLQVITRNPLAEPSILGVSGGASVGALIAIFMGAAGSIYVPLAAWVGALSILIILYLLLGSLSYQPTRLILAGVMLATACGAISSLLIVFADDVAMPGMIHWLMGDLDSVQSLEAVGSILGLWLATWIVVAKYAPQIHLMQFGFDKAKSLGVDVQRLQWLMVLMVALASAGAVSIAALKSAEFSTIDLADVARATFPTREIALDEKLELSFGRTLAANPADGIYAGVSAANELIALLSNVDGKAKPIAVFAAAH